MCQVFQHVNDVQIAMATSMHHNTIKICFQESGCKRGLTNMPYYKTLLFSAGHNRSCPCFSLYQEAVGVDFTK